MGTEIKAVPIGVVPIVPTALSKNLSGPMSISHMQGTPKTGYVSNLYASFIPCPAEPGYTLPLQTV